MEVIRSTALGLVVCLLYLCPVAAQLSSPLLQVEFNPPGPVMHTGAPTKVGGTTVYDHSEFGVRLTNHHLSAIQMQSVIFTSLGDKEKSGLGNIITYWPWRDKSRTLLPGQSISFSRVWGFTVDTPNSTMKYRFEFNYLVGKEKKQTRTVAELVLTPRP